VAHLINSQGLKLIKTHDGRYLLTPQQLESEIEAVLKESDGRVALGEMASILGVSLEVMEPHVNKVCVKMECEKVYGHMISQAYLAGIVEEIAELVQEQGSVNIQ